MRTEPVFILGSPTATQRQLFADAKRKLQIEYALKFEQARPGCGRVLSFEDRPPFICEYGVIKSEIPENIQMALAWYLGVSDAPQARSMADWLSVEMGGRVREVHE